MKNKFAMTIALLVLGSIGCQRVDAQDKDRDDAAKVKLTFVQGSSKKIEQLNGDCDWVAWDASGGTNCVRTTSQTATKFDVVGNDIGSSFEHNGKLIFLFGDTIGATDGSSGPAYFPTWISFTNSFKFSGGDPIAWSSTRRSEEGLLINFFPSTTTSGLPLLVKPIYPASSSFPQCTAGSNVPMGADDVPNSGISIDGQIYLVINTNADGSLAIPHLNACSILVRFDEATSTFVAGRILSQSYYPLPENEKPPLTGPPPPGTRAGHFVFTALHELPDGFGNFGPGALEGSPLGIDPWEPGVLIYGEGQYRGGSSGSSVYLSYISGENFWSGVDSHGSNATRYFAGFKNGLPTWSNQETDGVPVVYDNPNDVPVPDGQPGFADPGTVGNMSVTYSAELRLWLMTYDGGRQPGSKRPATIGIYFSYSSTPWGPWAAPQLIFNPCRDNGFGNFMRYYFDPSDPSKNTCPGAVASSAHSSGPAGPTIGDQTVTNPPVTQNGSVYAPFMIERFMEVQGDTLKIFYTMSTFNPYTIVEMESDFKINRGDSLHSSNHDH